MNSGQRKTGKPPDMAVALQYEQGDSAPQVTAAGRGELARRIVAVAKENGVPLVQDEDLAKALLKVPLGFGIPAELYEAVAAILAYLYRLEGALKR
jgi:flagellar biosynthesis protein